VIYLRRVPQVESFAPIENRSARVLVLGSMPGRASLDAQQYYAHPRNAFWKIMAALLRQPGLASLPYPRRIATLRKSDIALWDVLGSCTREGSLDSDIDDSSIVPNDFAGFFRRHPHVRRVFFNGAKAEQAYRRFVLPNLEGDTRGYLRLPSTSPAHASLSFDAKLEAWRVVVEGD